VATFLDAAKRSELARIVAEQEALNEGSSIGQHSGTDSLKIATVTVSANGRPLAIALSPDWRGQSGASAARLLDTAIGEAFAVAITAQVPQRSPEQIETTGRSEEITREAEAEIVAIQRATPGDVLSESAVREREDLREELTVLSERLYAAQRDISAWLGASATPENVIYHDQRVAVSIASGQVRGVKVDARWTESAPDTEIQRVVLELTQFEFDRVPRVNSDSIAQLNTALTAGVDPRQLLRRVGLIT
jgi:hypothetical protein